MRTGGQTHMTKLTVAFRNFAKAPKKQDIPVAYIALDSRGPPIIISEVTSKAHDGGQNTALCQKNEIQSERTHNKF